MSAGEGVAVKLAGERPQPPRVLAGERPQPPRVYEGMEPTEQEITLSWVELSHEVARYEIEYREADTAGEGGWQIASNQLTRPCCRKTGLRAGVAYAFRVRCLDADGVWGPFSDASPPIRTRRPGEDQLAAAAAGAQTHAARAAGAQRGERKAAGKKRPAPHMKASEPHQPEASATLARAGEQKRRKGAQPKAPPPDVSSAAAQHKGAEPHALAQGKEAEGRGARRPAKQAGHAERGSARGQPPPASPQPPQPPQPKPRAPAQRFRLLEPIPHAPQPPGAAAPPAPGAHGRAWAFFNAAFVPTLDAVVRVGDAVLLQPPDEGAARWIVRVRAIRAPLASQHAGAQPHAPSAGHAELVGQWYYRAEDTATGGPPQRPALGLEAEAEARARMRARAAREARGEGDGEEVSEGDGDEASDEPAGAPAPPAREGGATGSVPPPPSACQRAPERGSERPPALLAHSVEQMRSAAPLPARPLPASEPPQPLEPVYLFEGACEAQPLATIVGACSVLELPTDSLAAELPPAGAQTGEAPERQAGGGAGEAARGASAQQAPGAGSADQAQAHMAQAATCTAQAAAPAAEDGAATRAALPSFVCRMQYDPPDDRFLPLRPPAELRAGRVCTVRDCWEALLHLASAVDWARVQPGWQARAQWAHSTLLAGTPAKLARALLELGGALRPVATDAWAAACEIGAWEAAVRSAKSADALAEAAAQLRECVRADALLREGTPVPSA